MAAPTAGSNEQSAITTAHNTRALIPKNQKISPPRAPCTAATSRLPLKVARMTAVDLSTRACCCSGGSGMACVMGLVRPSPSRTKKNSRYNMMAKLTRKLMVPSPISAPPRQRTRCLCREHPTTSLAPQRGLSARGDPKGRLPKTAIRQGIAGRTRRDSTNPPACSHESWRPLAQRGCDQRQRQNDQGQDDQDRGESGKVLPLRHGVQQPLMQRGEHDCQHGRPEQRAEERPQDTSEGQRYREDEQQQGVVFKAAQAGMAFTFLWGSR